MPDDLKLKINKWMRRIGRKSAEKQLIICGVSLSAAQKLLAGTYASEPKRLLMEAIQMAMKDE